MRNKLFIWGPVFAAMGLFWWWHTPKGDPLSAAEVAEVVATAQAVGNTELGSAEAFLAQFGTDDGGPFYMINLISFRDRALYPEGHPEAVASAQEANRLYGRAILPMLLARGSYPVLLVSPKAQLATNAEDAPVDFEVLALVRYRSQRDFLDMISSEAFQTSVVHKWASVETTWVGPSSLMGSSNLGLIIPLALLSLGTLASLLVRPAP